MKYSIGDVVRVIDLEGTNLEGTVPIGSVGKITGIDKDPQLPYDVDFEEGIGDWYLGEVHLEYASIVSKPKLEPKTRKTISKKDIISMMRKARHRGYTTCMRGDAISGERIEKQLDDIWNQVMQQA